MAFRNKTGLKNCPILTKIGVHIDQTSDYYQAKFYQNRTTLNDDNLLQSCPILIKFCVVIVRSLVYMYTNFRQNRTIFRPYFGCEIHIKGRDNPKFWNFFSLTKIWIWPEFEKNPRCQTWGWFYTVSWNIGCGPTPIWAGWDWKYFSHLNNFQKGLMGPSFNKIPEMVVPNIVMR